MKTKVTTYSDVTVKPEIWVYSLL